MVQQGGPVIVAPANPPPVTQPVPTTTVTGVSNNTGSSSAAFQGTTTTGPATTGQSGSLNVPVSEGGPAPNSPTTVAVETVVPTGTPIVGLNPDGTPEDSGPAVDEATFGSDLERSLEDAQAIPVQGSFHDLLYAVYTQPPSEHTTLQGVNDGLVHLLNQLPPIPVQVPNPAMPI